ncbi:5'-deoxyadenosine deaminase [Candidatus Bilamarchaeum dharawalense]|uniref:5'-deoxyadenosine deaminase n=1 Tax=Candidatus Bilamarchaeum dharawalense TaxID=2885759 RepID=A0A5E4LQP1_9ARCH|nr:5'-deoxyadenosine deaminase [Candidatus Bilamarchaeum dharawalense]
MLEVYGGWIVLPYGIMKDASVIVEKDRIVDIGNAPKIRKKYKITRSVGSKNSIICPGFIDSHLHSYQIATRGLAAGKTLLDWLKIIWKWEGNMTKKQASDCARLAYVELISNGVTSFVDYTSVRHTEEAFKVASKLGLRATIGKTMMDRNSPPGLLEDTMESLRETERLIKKWHGKKGGRLRYAITPRFGITCTDQLLNGAVRLAKKYNTMITTHAHENIKEVEWDKKNYKKTAIAHFHELGILGKNTLLAHGIWLNDDEIGLLAKTKTSIAHCPGSNMALKSGHAPVLELLKNRVAVGLGSDVGAYHNFSMFDQMRLAILTQKKRGKIFDYKDAFKLATIGGAKAIGLEKEVGSLEKGKKADLVLLDGKKIVPKNDIVAQIVFCGDSSWVTEVICDGRILMKNRVVKQN